MMSFHDVLPRLFARDLSDADTIDNARLDRAENRLGIRLPEAVRRLYVAAGAAPEFQLHNRLLPPEMLRIDDGYVFFMEENQNVVDWALRVDTLAESPDPHVWQRVNGDQPEYYSEDLPFSTFIIRALEFMLGVDPCGQ